MHHFRDMKTSTKYLLKIAACKSQRRHILTWMFSKAENYLLDHPSPWITFDAIDFLEGWIKPGIRVFEYGSGGSTLFWQQFCSLLVSIEHDKNWYQVIRPRIDSQKVDYRLIQPEPGSFLIAQSEPADPHSYLTTDAAFTGYTFNRYARQIDEFPDESFDAVMIDGRSRPACILHGYPKVKSNGLLIVDNADRDYYLLHTLPYLEGFKRHSFFGVGPINTEMWQTDVFLRQNNHNYK